jgi:hypothetical protein
MDAGEDDRVADGGAEAPLTPAAVVPAEPVLPAAPADAAVLEVTPSGVVAVSSPSIVVAATVGITPSVAVPVPAPAPIVVVRPPRPCRIDFEGFTGTEAAKVEVRAWIDRLGELTDPLTSAEVAIEATHEPRKDRLFRVRMRLAMRAGVVVVAPDHPNNGPHEDIFCAIRNGFRAARRQLEGYLKEHPPVPPPPVTDAAPITAAAPVTSDAPATGEPPV